MSQVCAKQTGSVELAAKAPESKKETRLSTLYRQVVQLAYDAATK